MSSKERSLRMVKIWKRRKRNGTAHHSKEHRRKIGEANSRRIWTVESRRKVSRSLSKALKGRRLSDDWRRHIGEAQLGKVIPESRRKKISKGLRRYYKSKLARKQASERQKQALTKSVRAQIGSSVERAWRNRKIRSRMIKGFEKGWSKQSAHKNASVAKKKSWGCPSEKMLSALKKFQKNSFLKRYGKPNGLERKMKRILKKLGLKFKFQYVVGRRVADFLIRGTNLLIETDGDYWHRDRKAEKVRNRYLRRHGYAVKHFSEKQVKSDPQVVAAAIRDALS